MSDVLPDFSSDVMATSINVGDSGINVAPNSTVYSDSFTPTLCAAYDTITNSYTSNTSPRISS